MPDVNERDLETRIRRFIDAEILDGQGSDLTESTPLFDLAILDSFALFALVNFIEKEFGLALRLEAITVSDFNTTAAIAATVASGLRASRVAQ